MSAVFFLMLAVVIATIGSTVVYVRQRPPRSMESGIDGFRREMEALASSTDEPAGRHFTSRPLTSRPLTSRPLTSRPYDRGR